MSLDPRDTNVIFGRAQALKRLNRNQEALQLLLKAKDVQSDDIEFRARLGWFYIGQKNTLAAQKEFEFVLAADSNSSTAINGLGAALFVQALYDESEEKFRKALEADPNEPAFHTNLAWALVRTPSEPPSSLTKLTKWSRFSRQPDHVPPRQYLTEAEQHCRTALEIDTEYVSAYGCLGVIAFKRGQFLAAEEFFVTSIRDDPQRGEYVDLASLYTQMGRYDDSKKQLEQALKIDANDSRALVELGNLSFQLNETKEAIRLFRQAMHTNPLDEEPHNALAIALMRNGEYGEAGRVLRKAIRQLDESKRWRLHLTLSQLLTEVGDKNSDSELYEEALVEIRQAIALRPLHPDPYFHAGVVRFKLEDYRGALKDFHHSLQKDPDHFDAERNARLVQSFMREERRRTRGSLYAGVVMGIICIILLLSLWVLYLRPTTTKKITETMLITFSPMLLALSLVSFLLPWLIRLKLPGVEAELSQPKEKISKGPTGSIGFGPAPISSGPR